MLITTTDRIENYIIEKYLGTINANKVIGTSILNDLFASITDILGGSSDTYQYEMDNLFRKVIRGIESKCIKAGGNAIIGLRIDFDEISGQGKSMFMISAVGTAVIAKPDRYGLFKKLSELKKYLSDELITQDEFERESERINAQYENQVAEETKQIEIVRSYEERMLREKEQIEKKIQIEKERNELYEQKALAQQALIKNSFSDLTEMNGFKIGDLIEVVDSGDYSTIDGFTVDGKIICSINSKLTQFTFEEIRLA